MEPLGIGCPSGPDRQSADGHRGHEPKREVGAADLLAGRELNPGRCGDVADARVIDRGELTGVRAQPRRVRR